MSFVKSRRGGHFPGHLRDAFVDAADAMREADGRDALVRARVRIDDWRTGEERHYTLPQIFGMMWNCTDIMPSLLCNEIGDINDAIRPGCTYAQGARALKREYESVCALGAD